MRRQCIVDAAIWLADEKPLEFLNVLQWTPNPQFPCNSSEFERGDGSRILISKLPSSGLPKCLSSVKTFVLELRSVSLKIHAPILIIRVTAPVKLRVIDKWKQGH